MRNVLIGIVSCAALGAAFIAAATPAYADDLYVFGGAGYHPQVFGTAYGPDAAPPGAVTQAGVCWLFPPHTRGAKWEEVCK